MAQILSCSIDVSKIDKSKLISGKNGAQYFNFDVIVNDKPNEYGKDVSIAIQQTKEERQAKNKKTFIGGGKTVWKSNSELPNKEKEFRVPDKDGDLPF
jgi:hypothetical protein